MNLLFLKIVNRSISAGWLILAVLVCRIIFKKAPKWMHMMLWGMTAVRLLCPFTIESALSLIPSAETIPEHVLYSPSFDIQTGMESIDHRVNGYLGDHYFEGITVPADYGRNVTDVLAVIWLAGAAVMAGYTAVSCFRLYQRVRTAVLLRDNIFQSENAVSPFLFGILRPKIYIPFGMKEQNLKHVAAHEQAHIQRKDHWWKPAGFLLLIIYWFHPLVWLSYILFCRDMEFACDEKVIRELENEQRADYSRALLECSVSRRKPAVCPLAFGETGVKERIKNVLNYKKPVFGMVFAAAAVCLVTAVCFLTSPTSAADTDRMVPSAAGMRGVFDSYLYISLQGETYRYECIASDTEGVTKDSLLDEFTEKADDTETVWRVYSLKEYPDYSTVLAAAGQDYKSLYRYSPSKRSQPDALQSAKKDGRVVMEDGDVASGQQIWQDFVTAAEQGNKASVKVSYYYTLDPDTCSEEYYQAYKEDYPVIYYYDLSYNGNSYVLRAKEGDTEYVKNYQYLMHYTGDKLSPYANYDSYTYYVLTNDHTVTWEDLWQGMISSQSGDGIDHFIVYTDLE